MKKPKSKPKQKSATSVNVKIKKEQKLQDAPVEQYFILANGQPVKNVKELADTLEHISEHVFNHHVNNDKNDFANWARDVFKEVQLAEELSGTKNKDHTRIVLYKHVISKTHK